MAARKRTLPVSSRGRGETQRSRAEAQRELIASRHITAQDVADWCEVDLKTIHHWVRGGKIPHRRTDGGHLRFRRNDVVRFLRLHEFPFPRALTESRLTLALATPSTTIAPLTVDDLAKKLASRFAVTRFSSAIVAFGSLYLDEPDAIVIANDDSTISTIAALEALKSDSRTAWAAVAVVVASGPDAEESLTEAKAAGADVVITSDALSKLGLELARALGVDEKSR